MTYGFAGLLCGSALIAGFSGDAFALDRRFELDPRLLEQKVHPVAKARQARPLPPASSVPPAKRVIRKVDARVRQAPAKAGSLQRGKLAGLKSAEGRLSLFKIVPPPVSGETQARSLWDRLIPGGQPEGPLQLEADNISMTFDPRTYQIMPAADGGKIIVDTNRTIPSFVKNFIQEKDSTLRIVSASPTDGKRFYSEMLRAAGFYSVEPDFTMEFGEDPRLLVRAEYRIERTSESLIRNETVLLFTDYGRYAMPPSLQGFLGEVGFQVIEPDLPPHGDPAYRDRFMYVSGGGPLQVTDKVLAALGLKTEVGKVIDGSGWSRSGITLKVRVDRAFDSKGNPYVVTVNDGNPATHALARFLESEGVTVVLLAPEDDFRAVTGKLLAALKLSAGYETHRLWPLRETPYTVQISGFRVNSPVSGRTVFLTDREVTPLMIDLMVRNGYAVTGVQP